MHTAIYASVSTNVGLTRSRLGATVDEAPLPGRGALHWGPTRRSRIFPCCPSPCHPSADEPVFCLLAVYYLLRKVTPQSNSGVGNVQGRGTFSVLADTEGVRRDTGRRRAAVGGSTDRAGRGRRRAAGRDGEQAAGGGRRLGRAAEPWAEGSGRRQLVSTDPLSPALRAYVRCANPEPWEGRP